MLNQLPKEMNRNESFWVNEPGEEKEGQVGVINTTQHLHIISLLNTTLKVNITIGYLYPLPYQNLEHTISVLELCTIHKYAVIL